MSGVVLVAVAAAVGNLLQGWDNATIADGGVDVELCCAELLGKRVKDWKPRERPQRRRGVGVLLRFKRNPWPHYWPEMQPLQIIHNPQYCPSSSSSMIRRCFPRICPVQLVQ